MSGRYKGVPDPQCRHARKGIVKAGDPDGAYAATDVCSRAACIADAMAWAQTITGEPASYQADNAPKQLTLTGQDGAR